MAKNAEGRRLRTSSDPHELDCNLSDQGFDRWFRRQVHRIYDDTMQEPLPEHLAELLDRFPSQPSEDRTRDNDAGHGGAGRASPEADDDRASGNDDG